jgi:DNA-binding IclR family transcriptional regulator
MVEAERPKAAVQSIERAASILRSFTEAEPELGVTELSQRLGLHKSTVSRIIATLQREGLVGQNPDTGKYRLGVGLVSLAGVALGRINVRGAAQPHLDQLVQETQETVTVDILMDGVCLIVEQKESPQAVRYVSWIGRRFPLHCTASGKVFLAAMSESEREERLVLPLPKYTSSTITSYEALQGALEEVTTNGYAVALEEYETGFGAISAPILNHDGQVVAALTISAPSFRLSKTKCRQLVPCLHETTAAISAELGYTSVNEK